MENLTAEQVLKLVQISSEAAALFTAEEIQILKQTVIANRVAAQIKAGKSAREAMDAVCGVGAYDRLVADLYRDLQAAA